MQLRIVLSALQFLKPRNGSGLTFFETLGARSEWASQISLRTYECTCFEKEGVVFDSEMKGDVWDLGLCEIRISMKKSFHLPFDISVWELEAPWCLQGLSHRTTRSQLCKYRGSNESQDESCSREGRSCVFCASVATRQPQSVARFVLFLTALMRIQRM